MNLPSVETKPSPSDVFRLSMQKISVSSRARRANTFVRDLEHIHPNRSILKLRIERRRRIDCLRFDDVDPTGVAKGEGESQKETNKHTS